MRYGSEGSGVVDGFGCGLAAALVAVPSFAFAAEDAGDDSSDEVASVAAAEAQVEPLANEKTKVIDGVTYSIKF